MGCAKRVSRRSELEREIGSARMVGIVEAGSRIFQMRRRGGRFEKPPVDEGDFGRNREVERCYAAHIVGMNVHDVEVPFDFLNERIE